MIEEEIKSNAIFYKESKDRLPELDIKDINNIRVITNDIFKILLSDVNVVFVKGQPYKGLADLTQDFIDKNKIKVSRDNNNSKLFGRDCNLKFRAVHDYYHILLNAGFDYTGEKAVYDIQSTNYPKEYHKILHSEIVLQAAYFIHYGEFGEQKIVY